MMKPTFMSGHTYEISRPCTIYAMYCDRTGTIIFEYTWCDGEHFSVKDLDRSDVDRFYLELQAFLIEQDF